MEYHQFFDILPPEFESCKEGRENRSRAFLKLIKVEAEFIYIIQQYINFSKHWYSFKSLAKAFKPYYRHKLILT